MKKKNERADTERDRCATVVGGKLKKRDKKNLFNLYL